jgi:uncharacterized protein YegP (UPF0339 family)
MNHITFEVYKDTAGEFRWRMRAANGNIIGTSGEGYKNGVDCTNVIGTIMTCAESATIVQAPENE